MNTRVAGTKVFATLAHEIRRCGWRATRITKGTCPRAIGIGDRSRAGSTGIRSASRRSTRSRALNQYGFLDLTGHRMYLHWSRQSRSADARKCASPPPFLLQLVPCEGGLDKQLQIVILGAVQDCAEGINGIVVGQSHKAIPDWSWCRRRRIESACGTFIP